jgi:Ca-activated chloride channel homolog
MRTSLAALLTLFLVSTALAEDSNTNRASLTIAAEALGDNAAGVVTRTTFKFNVPSDVPPQVPLVINGSISQNGTVLKNFRYPLTSSRSELTTIQTLPPGEVEIEARVMIPLEEQAPLILGKTTKTFTIAKTNKPYTANIDEGAESVIAEGIVPEESGTVKIMTPRRDVAPNLFIVDVEVTPPVKKVEFWVEGKKIMTRNAPPYHAELDLGNLPKRVEVKAIGYDAQGHYIDADAFVVNERETPLEVKLTRVVTPDNVSHIKMALHNPKNTTIKSAVLFAGQKKIFEWSGPPYAVNLPADKLAGVDFIRVSVTDETNYEASDLLFLNGDRFMEEIDVNLIELPVSVADATGAPISNLEQKNFSVFEDGKPQKIASFNYAANLPISAGVLVDHSGSMEKRMKETEDAALEFFKDIIKGQDRAFIAAFAFDATKIAPFVSNLDVLASQVNAIPEASGGTSLYDAIITGLYRFRGVQGRKALIVLSDGEDTTSRIGYDEMLNYVRASRVPLYFIGIGLGIGDFSGTSKMKAMAAETGGVAYFIKDVKDLHNTYVQLEKELRTQYLITYNAEATKKDQKYRTVEVKVDRPDAKVRTIRGYIP